jgi:hypothetical protein
MRAIGVLTATYPCARLIFLAACGFPWRDSGQGWPALLNSHSPTWHVRIDVRGRLH